MGSPLSLEAQLTAVMHEFVARIVTVLRAASFDDVARLGLGMDSTPISTPPPAPFRARVAASPTQPTSGHRVPGESDTHADAQRARNAQRRLVSAKGVDAMNAQRGLRASRPRQTVEVRAELASRILDALHASGEPLGVRTLAAKLGVDVDLLTAPLIELRNAERVNKHGEKRKTTYSVRE
jgi:hypothetical protein